VLKGRGEEEEKKNKIVKRKFLIEIRKMVAEGHEGG